MTALLALVLSAPVPKQPEPITPESFVAACKKLLPPGHAHETDCPESPTVIAVIERLKEQKITTVPQMAALWKEHGKAALGWDAARQARYGNQGPYLTHSGLIRVALDLKTEPKPAQLPQDARSPY